MIILIIVIVLLLFYMIYRYCTSGYNVHKFYGKVAKNKDELRDGLMYRKDKLKDNYGMLFPMNYGINSMWMKNTYIPLDIVFLDDNMKVVGYIEDAEPLSLKPLKIDKKSNNVLELKGNTISKNNIKIGHKIIFIEDDK